LPSLPSIAGYARHQGTGLYEHGNQPSYIIHLKGNTESGDVSIRRDVRIHGDMSRAFKKNGLASSVVQQAIRTRYRVISNRGWLSFFYGT
jgi:hypothetical protein